MVSNASEALPEPDTPVTTVIWLWGMESEMFLRLWTRAPRIRIASCTGVWLGRFQYNARLSLPKTTKEPGYTSLPGGMFHDLLRTQRDGCCVPHSPQQHHQNRRGDPGGEIRIPRHAGKPFGGRNAGSHSRYLAGPDTDSN